MRRTITGLLALAFIALLGLAAPDAGVAGYDCSVEPGDCSNDWSKNAKARNYCTTPTFTVSEDCKCDMAGSTCSITADVFSTSDGVTSTTWTPSMVDSARPDQLDDIDICFNKNSDETAFVARLRYSCQSGETGSKDAVDHGLCLSGCRN